MIPEFEKCLCLSWANADLQEVAQSLNIEPLGEGAAELLAGDVEYRLHLIVSEAKKFMIHGKRSTLMPDDIEHALEVLNVEVGRVPSFPLLREQGRLTNS